VNVQRPFEHSIFRKQRPHWVPSGAHAPPCVGAGSVHARGVHLQNVGLGGSKGGGTPLIQHPASHPQVPSKYLQVSGTG
jgi:hypothetical protein